MTTEQEALPEEAGPQAWEPGSDWDTVITVFGLVVTVIATVVTAIIELELSALRTGAFQEILRGDSPWEGSGAAVPLAVPVAIGANLAIGWFAVSTTGRRWALGLPWALWTLIMLIAAGTRSTEGDYLLGGENWVALVTILAGSLTFAVHSYKMILKPLAPKNTDSGLSADV